MRDIQCPHCESYINALEIVTRCTECKELIYKPKTKEMKATLENFLIKWDGNNPLWKEFIEWLNKVGTQSFFRGDSQNNFYGIVSCNKISTEELDGLEKELLITLEQWQQLLTPKTMNNFKKGDKVFVYPYGWCEVDEPEIMETNVMSVKQGCNYYAVPYHYVSFTEYTLEGFTQERPFEPVVGNYYWFWNKGTLETSVVGWGLYIGKSNDELKPYIFGSLTFSFCSETNPLL
jgi:hypothetical protein